MFSYVLFYFLDETPENCELFITHGGIDLFMDCKMVSYSHVLNIK